VVVEAAADLLALVDLQGVHSRVDRGAVDEADRARGAVNRDLGLRRRWL
jgi:hypothetical protein